MHHLRLRRIRIALLSCGLAFGLAAGWFAATPAAPSTPAVETVADPGHQNGGGG